MNLKDIWPEIFNVEICGIGIGFLLAVLTIIGSILLCIFYDDRPRKGTKHDGD